MRFSSLRGSPMIAHFWLLRGKSNFPGVPHSSIRNVISIALVVEMRAPARARAVDIVEREARCPEVRDLLRIDLPLEARGRIEGHVVIEELPEEGEPGRQRRVVRVVHGQRGVGDQVGRRLVQVVRGIHDSAGLADVEQRRAGLRRVGSECGQVAEQPAETAGIVSIRTWAERCHAGTRHDRP